MFANQAFAIPLANPPFFKRLVIESTSYLLNLFEMFFILVEYILYSLSSFSVRETLIGITTGFASLLSLTAFLIGYFIIGGNTANIVLFLKSLSSKVAVSPKIAF